MRKFIKRGVHWMLVMMVAACMMPAGGSGFSGDVYGAEKSVNTNKVKGSWVHFAATRFASGNGTKENPYIIESAEQLALLAKIVNDSGTKKNSYTKFNYYKVAKDIDLSAHYWTPVGKIRGNLFASILRGKVFRGHFDGNGHLIKGLTTKKTELYAGLFGVVGEITESANGVSGAEFDNEKDLGKSTRDFVPVKDYDRSKMESGMITNVRLGDVKIEGKGYAGGVAGYAIASEITRCSVSGKVKGKKFAGGVVGRCFESDVKDNGMKGSVQSGAAAGGLIGVFYGIDGGAFKAGRVHATVKGGVNVGGLIGKYDKMRSGPAPTVFLSKDVHQVKVVGKTNVGGAIGYFEHQFLEKEGKGFIPQQFPVTIRNIYVKGSVSGKKNVGGIIGFEGGQNLSFCGFEGEVKGSENTGGMVGYKQSGLANAGKISKSYVHGKVTGKKNTGGFIGNILTVYNVFIEQSWYSGTLKGGDATGGFLGAAQCNNVNITLNNVYASGKVNGCTNTGGMFGRIDENDLRFVFIRSSFVSAKVTGSGEGRGIVFGQSMVDYHTKLSAFYYDATKNRTGETGIVSSGSNAAIFGKATPVDTGRLARKKLSGFNEKKIWIRTKPTGKTGSLPQLRVFAKSKNKRLRSVSASGARIPAYQNLEGK